MSSEEHLHNNSMKELIEKYHNLVAALIPEIVEAGMFDVNDDVYSILCAKKSTYLEVIKDLESLERSMNIEHVNGKSL